MFGSLILTLVLRSASCLLVTIHSQRQSSEFFAFCESACQGPLFLLHPLIFLSLLIVSAIMDVLVSVRESWISPDEIAGYRFLGIFSFAYKSNHFSSLWHKWSDCLQLSFFQAVQNGWKDAKAWSCEGNSTGSAILGLSSRFKKFNLMFGSEENMRDTWVSRRLCFIKISKHVSWVSNINQLDSSKSSKSTGYWLYVLGEFFFFKEEFFHFSLSKA